jgi:hypothetical protein
LLAAVAAFVRTARDYPGVLRIALLGSLATDKPIPKDADVLVTIEGSMDLTKLARAGRQLKGATNSINLSADIFLAEEAGRYLGRICPYRECHLRVLCHAQHCGQRELIAAPPVDLWPKVVRRVMPPPDVEELLLAELEHPRYR